MAKQYHYGDPDRPAWCEGDPRPQREDPHAERIRNAQLAREIQRSQTLSGTHSDGDGGHFLVGPYRRVVHRDAHGRLVIDWERAHEQPDG